jgi:hypothetical protein
MKLLENGKKSLLALSFGSSLSVDLLSSGKDHFESLRAKIALLPIFI